MNVFDTIRHHVVVLYLLSTAKEHCYNLNLVLNRCAQQITSDLSPQVFVTFGDFLN